MKAIETVYNGYRFRSRLEARWAVFFDTLGVEYEYELEGFDLSNSKLFPNAGYYLPDFFLPGLRVWVEVKNGKRLTDNEIIKIIAFGEQLGQETYIVSRGLPDKGFVLHNPNPDPGGRRGFVPSTCVWACGRKDLEEIWIIEQDHNFGFCLNSKTGSYEYLLNCEKLSNAYQVARQARFEFGENGK